MVILHIALLPGVIEKCDVGHMSFMRHSHYNGLMLLFVDETFRTHKKSNTRFGAMCGVAIPEDLFHSIQTDIFALRRPYHGKVLDENDEIHGQLLLNGTTFKMRERQGYSYHWNLAEELLLFARKRKLKVFGVVCFRSDLHSFVCGNDTNLDITFRYLFERIDLYMKRDFPGRFAKLIFDNRDHRTHEQNAKAITNFFVRSTVGLGYDSILRVPFFAVSQGHNYGLQLADLITTVIGLRFQGEPRIQRLWNIIHDMMVMQQVGSQMQSSLKVMREAPSVQRLPT